MWRRTRRWSPARALGRPLNCAWRVRTTAASSCAPRTSSASRIGNVPRARGAGAAPRGAEVRGARTARRGDGSPSAAAELRRRHGAALRCRSRRALAGESLPRALPAAARCPGASTCWTSPRPRCRRSGSWRCWRCCATLVAEGCSSCSPRTRRCCWRIRARGCTASTTCRPRPSPGRAGARAPDARLPRRARALPPPSVTVRHVDPIAPPRSAACSPSPCSASPRRRRLRRARVTERARRRARRRPGRRCYYDGAPQSGCPTPRTGPAADTAWLWAAAIDTLYTRAPGTVGPASLVALDERARTRAPASRAATELARGALVVTARARRCRAPSPTRSRGRAAPRRHRGHDVDAAVDGGREAAPATTRPPPRARWPAGPPGRDEAIPPRGLLALPAPRSSAVVGAYAERTIVPERTDQTAVVERRLVLLSPLPDGRSAAVRILDA